MDEHTMLNIRKAWLSKLQLSKDAERTQVTPLTTPRCSPHFGFTFNLSSTLTVWTRNALGTPDTKAISFLPSSN